jgi:hypothetical protein
VTVTEVAMIVAVEVTALLTVLRLMPYTALKGMRERRGERVEKDRREKKIYERIEEEKNGRDSRGMGSGGDSVTVDIVVLMFS